MPRPKSVKTKAPLRARRKILSEPTEFTSHPTAENSAEQTTTVLSHHRSELRKPERNRYSMSSTLGSEGTESSGGQHGETDTISKNYSSIVETNGLKSSSQKLSTRTTSSGPQNADICSKAQSTPLALANFKRRPRKPSILQAASRDISLLQNPSADVEIARSPHLSPLSSPSEISRQKASTSEDLRKRKRSPFQGSSDCERPSKHPVPSSPSPGSPLSLPRLLIEASPQTPQRILSRDPQWQVVVEEHMTPPQSSSPTIPTGNSRNGSVQSIATSNQSSRVAAPGQQRQQQGVPKAAKPSRPMTTADLQDLLPRRCARSGQSHETQFDIYSTDRSSHDGVSDDEDELSRRVTKKTHASQLKAKASREKSQQRKRNMSRATTSTKAGASKPKANYTRKKPDKENETHFVKDGGQGIPTKPSKHKHDCDLYEETRVPTQSAESLQAIAQKFKEVDRWELEFEPVTALGSSPKSGR